MGSVRNIVLGLLLASWCFYGGPALAQKRVALVIGNGIYERAPRLDNPANDAALIAETFKKAGFDSVDLKRDLKVSDMRRALRDFVDKASDADIAVVYYAGHGIEVDGMNYLIPVDAVLDRDRDIYDEGLSLERVLVAVEPAKKLRLVILDACRDNPFGQGMRRTVASRGVRRGLAKVEPMTPNTLIAFAAKAGSTASDGDASNSPFAAALVEYLPRPGLDIRRAFGFVRDDVLKNTGNKQEPYVYGSLGGEDVPLVPATAPAASQADPQASIRRDYELALQLATRGGWEAFLSRYPDGFYASLARGQLAKIAAEEVRAAAAEKARIAEQERARLVEQGARQAELDKAVAAAKAAEEARIVAEEAKRAAQEKLAAAEAAGPERDKAQGGKETNVAAMEQSVATAEKLVADEREHQLAALFPSQQRVPLELTVALQEELRRVGCNTGAVDGQWDAASERALQLFNIYAGAGFDPRSASADALRAVKRKSGRICPLVCDFGYRAEGSGCRKVVCRAGYELNDLGSCEKLPAKRAFDKPDRPKPKPVQGARVDAAPIPQAAARVFCDSQGCRPLGKGCRLETGWAAGQKNRNSQYEVCP